MRRAVGRWLVETRTGRMVSRVVTVVFVLGAAYAVIHEEVDRQTQEITERVEVIERVRPVDVLRECLRSPRCARLVRNAPDLDRSTQGGDADQPPAGNEPLRPREGGERTERRDGDAPRRERPEPDPRSPAPSESPAAPSAPATESDPPSPSEPPEPARSTPIRDAVEDVGDAVRGVTCKLTPPLCP